MALRILNLAKSRPSRRVAEEETPRSGRSYGKRDHDSVESAASLHFGDGFVGSFVNPTSAVRAGTEVDASSLQTP
jgi:hypothetical protein